MISVELRKSIVFRTFKESVILCLVRIRSRWSQWLRWTVSVISLIVSDVADDPSVINVNQSRHLTEVTVTDGIIA